MKRAAMMIAVLCSTASASDMPVGSNRDGRIRYVNYSVDDVVNVELAEGRTTRIIMGQGEAIQHVYTGYPEGYTISNTTTSIAIKPHSMQAPNGVWVSPNAEWSTTLDVETLVNGSDARHYSFEIGISDTPFQRLHVRYPLDVESARLQDEQAKAEAAEAAEAKAIRDVIKVKNLDYVAVVNPGSESIEPLTTFDDGRHTFINFRPGTKMPKAFLDGNESVSNGKVEKARPDTIRIQTIAGIITLRLGNKVVKITNLNHWQAVN